MTDRRKNILGIIASIVATIVFLSVRSCSAGDRHAVRVARQNRKAIEAQTGATLQRMAARRYRWETASNVTAPFNWFSPGGIIRSLIRR